jgi:ATP-binding cassette subfamily C protein LapB
MNENSNKVLDLFNKDHWFWGAFHQNWWTYGQVILAAIMINFFSLGSSIFIMTV